MVQPEIIELRRFHRRSGQHGVNLPAMVDVVGEKMREEAVDALRNRAVGAGGRDGAGEVGLGQRVA